MDDVDEVALNTLIAEGVDLPTALVGSTRDPQLPSGLAPIIGAILGIITLVAIWYFVAR